MCSASAVDGLCHAATISPGTIWHCPSDGTLGQSDVSIYSIDLFDTSTCTIGSLKRQARTNLCYFNVGSRENWRLDANDFPSTVKGDFMADGAGETWLDITRPELRSTLSTRLDLMVRKDCDGIEPDNADVYASNREAGLGITQAQLIIYNR